jgi:hypothetical protein
MAKGPGYPTLAASERAEASRLIKKHLNSLSDWPGGEKQAIAVGLAQAAPEKYKKFRARKANKKPADGS